MFLHVKFSVNLIQNWIMKILKQKQINSLSRDMFVKGFDSALIVLAVRARY